MSQDFFPAQGALALSSPFDELTREQKAAAIAARTSVRAYEGRAIEDEKIALLRRYIEYANAAQDTVELGLHGPFENAGEACGIAKSMFAGTFHWFASLSYAVSDAAEEVCGWYGEELIVLATHLGLGTCWVAGTYNKEKTAEFLGAPQVQVVIPLGYEKKPTPLRQRTIRAAIRRNAKRPQQMCVVPESYEDAPEWFKSGMNAAAAAPSAVNQQVVTFSLHDNTVSANCGEKRDHRQPIDLGIAKPAFPYWRGRCGRVARGARRRFRARCAECGLTA